MSLLKSLSLSKLPVANRFQLLTYLLRLFGSKQFYLNVDRIFRDPTGLDYTLSFVAYSLLFVSQVMAKRIEWKRVVAKGYARVLRATQTTEAAGPAGDRESEPATEKTTGEKPITKTASEVASDRLSAREVVVAGKLQKVSSYISDVRIFNRMWACIPMIPWGIDLVRESSTLLWSNPDRLVNYAQVFNGIVLQALENVGFMGDHSFTTQSESLSLWANLWCGRLWAAYVALDLVQLIQVPRKQRDRRWINTFMYQLANVPLTIHWSLEHGLIDRTLVGFFGAFGAYYKVRDFWAAVGDGC